MQLPNELKVFSTPWHWIVHGLGLGQRPTGFDSDTAERLTELNRSLLRRFRDPFQVFVYELTKTIRSDCEAAAHGAPGHDEKVRMYLVRRLADLQDASAHARGCALLIDSLLELDPGPARSRTSDLVLRESVVTALRRVTALVAPTDTDKDRYEQLHLLALLFLSAGRAGWSDLITAPSRVGARGLEAAWQLLASLSDPFYRARAAALLFTILGLVGLGDAVFMEGDGPGGGGDHLLGLLDLLDAEFDRAPVRASDGVHQGRDYRMFPLSLTLSAIGMLGRQDALDYKRDWLDLAAAEMARLTPASRASQSLFYVAALKTLGVLETYVPDPRAYVCEVTDGYLGATDGARVDDYLRATYLVHLAEQLGCSEALAPRVGEILASCVARIGDSPHRPTNPYASGFMTLAYALSTLRAGGPGRGMAPVMAPWLERRDLARAVSRILTNEHDTTLHLPRLDRALIDAALRLRPPAAQDPWRSPRAPVEAMA